MKRRSAALLALTVLGLVAAAWLAFGSGALGSASPSAVRSPSPHGQPTAVIGATPQRSPTLQRDLFRFGEERAPAAAGTPVARGLTPSANAAPPEVASPPAEGPRLLGFVRTPAGVRAALALGVEIEVLAPEEQGQGYRVLAIDEDGGSVRLRTPADEEIVLTVAPH